MGPTVEPASQPGMGAIPAPLGTTFRVWAPNAREVAVMGSFSDWQPLALHHEADGYWAADVVGALVGHEYKFVVTTPEGHTLPRNDPYAREVTASDGNSVIHDPAFDWEGDEFRMPAWNELVIYELHVGTFNPKSADEPGTFYDVIERLPYLQALGINAIEVMPPTEFPGGRSWGYNPAHPFALETSYGGPRAFKELVRQAHRHGIAIILDVVYNHFGPDHLDLWQFDGWQENDGGGIYFYNDWRAQTPWGDTRPDYGRPEVRQYIRDNAVMWLDEYRVDGLRTDALAYVRNVHGSDDPGADLPEGWALMQWLNEEVRTRSPWKITVAEDLKGNAAITQPVADGGEGFSTQWDVGFAYAIRHVITAPLDEHRSMQELADALQHRYNDDAFQRVIFTESHDEVANGVPRLPGQINPGDPTTVLARKRAALGIGILLTAPGIPMLFQGQELLEDGSWSDTNPLNWGRLRQFGGLAHLFRDLIHLRRNLHGTTRGLTGQHLRLLHLHEDTNVLAWLRWTDADTAPGDVTLVVANLSANAYDDYRFGLPVDGTWHVRFNADWQGYDAEFGDFESTSFEAQPEPADDLPFSGSLGIGAYSLVILSK